MSTYSPDNFKDAIYDAMEVSLAAQLRAIKRLRKGEKEVSEPKKRTSQIDIAHDILLKSAHPLHINELLKQIENVHQVQLDRESLVSAITKKIKREDRFIRTGKNVFTVNKEKTS